MLTQIYVKRLFDYDETLGHLLHKVDKGHNKVKGKVAHNNQSTCSTVSINDKTYLAHRIIWLWYYGYLPENFIDHVDRNPHNNKIDNLREASNQCNQRNTGNPKDNTSGVKGVYWHKKRNKWKAEIRINGKGLYLGSYESFTDAVCARLAGEQCLNWSGCDTNSPAYTYVKENYGKEK